MAWYNFLKKTVNIPLETKQTSAFFSVNGTYSTTNPDTLAREGYVLNASVNSAINKIIKAIVQMKLVVTNKNDENKTPIEGHKLQKLLDNPDKNQGQSEWLTEYFSYYLLFGNSFIYKTALENGMNAGQAMALKVLSERQIDTITKETIFGTEVSRYEFLNRKSFPLKAEDLLHGKTFNPENQALGLSPLMACGLSVDIDNEAKRWNISLLQNGVNPSGVYTVDGELTEGQVRRLRNQLQEKSGSSNAGSEKVLEGGMSFQATGLSPKDADFSTAQLNAKREIASVYNIAPQLIGDTESQTFANYEQAVLSLHNDTAYPLLENLVGMLNNWLTPAFGNDIIITIDDSDVEALQAQRQGRWASIDASNELSTDEKRSEKGYQAIGGQEGDSVIVGSTTTLKNIVSPGGPMIKEAIEAESFKADFPEKISFKQYSKFQQKAMTDNEDDAIKVSHKIINKYFKLQLKEMIKNLADTVQVESMTSAVEAVIQQTTPELEAVYNEIYKDIGFDFALKARFEGKASIRQALEIKETKAITDEFNILNDYKDEFGSFVDSYFTQIKIGVLIKDINKETMKMVDGVITNGVKSGASVFDVTKDIQKMYGKDMELWRAERIARTETLRATSYAQHEQQLKVSPLSKKFWIASEDNRTRPSKGASGEFNHRTADLANGKVDMNDSFKVSSEALMFPRDTSFGASGGNTINCRCSVGYIDEEFESFFED